MPASYRVHCGMDEWLRHLASRCFSGFKLISMKRNYAIDWNHQYKAKREVTIGVNTQDGTIGGERKVSKHEKKFGMLVAMWALRKKQGAEVKVADVRCPP